MQWAKRNVVELGANAVYLSLYIAFVFCLFFGAATWSGSKQYILRYRVRVSRLVHSAIAQCAVFRFLSHGYERSWAHVSQSRKGSRSAVNQSNAFFRIVPKPVNSLHCTIGCKSQTAMEKYSENEKKTARHLGKKANAGTDAAIWISGVSCRLQSGIRRSAKRQELC